MRHFGEFAEEPLDADEDVVAVMLPDDLVLPAGAMDRMVAVRERLGGSVLCAFNVTRDEVFNYGVFDVEDAEADIDGVEVMRGRGMVEKPAVEDAPADFEAEHPEVWESRVPNPTVSESPLEPGPTLLLDGYLKDPFGNEELTMGFWGEIGNQVSECYLQTWANDFEDLVPQELEAERGNSSRPADLTFVASMESVDYSDDNGTPPGVFVLCRFEPNSVWAVDPPYRDFVIPKMQIESPRGLPAGNFCVESATPGGTWSETLTTSTRSDCSEGAQRIALEGQSAQLEDAGERRTRDFKVLASGVFAGLAAESAINLLRSLFIPGSRNGWRRREHD